jgi:1-acyl-sn-glycerol-3-phosphate acyltransferase
MGLLSFLARSFVHAWVRVYYPKIEVVNPERIPQSGPVLLAANHPNSLLDPVIIGISAQRPVRFMAKAPLFDVPVFGSILRALGMVPAFRGSDDASQVGRNADSLSAGSNVLAEGGAFGIFPEGKTHDLARVEMVRSGASRMAIQAAQQGVQNLKVVPLGINYERKEKFRSAIWVRVGEPIDVNEWLKQQENDTNKATRRLTAEIDKRLKELVVHLNEEQWQPFLSDLEVLLPPPPEIAREVVAPLRQRKRIADAMNYFLAGDRPRAQAMADAITAHQKNLATEGLTIHSPIIVRSRWNLFVRLFLDLLWLILFFVPATIGAIHHLIPFLLVRLAAPKIQTPGNTTVSLARLGLGIPVYAAWYGFILWLMLKYEFRPWLICVWLIPMPIVGVLALEYWPRARDAAALWWHEIRLLARRSVLGKMREDQYALSLKLKDLAAEYARVYPPGTLQMQAFQRKQYVSQPGLAWAAGVLCCAGLAWALWQLHEAPIAELDSRAPDLSGVAAESFELALAADEKALADIISGLNELELSATGLRNEFAAGTRSYYKQADNDAVRKTLLTFLNFRAALFRIVWKYQNYEQLGDEKMRLRAFLCNYTAAAVLNEAALKFVTQFNRSAETVKKLNEGEPAWNIPPNVFDTVRHNVMRFESQKLLAAAHGRYRQLRPQMERAGLIEGQPYAAFHSAIDDAAQTVAELAPGIWKQKLAMSEKDALDASASAAYRVQTLVATWIGDTKIRAPRKGQTLINPERLAALKEKLRPGDILLERRNWFLSNAFLPGYWPHAAVYAGTAEQLAELGVDKDPRVAKHFEEYAKRDEHEHSLVIVEALSEGVVFASLEHSIGGGDSVAVLRPRIPPERLKECICRAFSHAGKPYDFEFDFFSTDKIVCTELVFRSYAGDVDFTLVDVMGTKTLPAIEMVRKFNAEYGKDDAQLEFIAFLDGNEKTGECISCNVEAFMGTIKRPGMTWLQGLVNEPEEK